MSDLPDPTGNASPTTTVASPIALARDVRPQTIGSISTDRVFDPIVEPLWTGVRVIAATEGYTGVLYEDGVVLEGHDLLVHALGRLAGDASDGAIFDGFLTKQIAREVSGDWTGIASLPTTSELMSQQLIGRRRNKAEELAEQRAKEREARIFAENEPVNLIVVDLLWLDGEWLLDIPLLERKRLLDAILPGVELVRAGVFVRPPIDTWVGSWRSQGFEGVTFKAANSRYHPGTVATDWATMSMPRR